MRSLEPGLATEPERLRDSIDGSEEYQLSAQGTSERQILQIRALYLSHFLTTWQARTYEFAAVWS